MRIRLNSAVHVRIVHTPTINGNDDLRILFGFVLSTYSWIRYHAMAQLRDHFCQRGGAAGADVVHGCMPIEGVYADAGTTLVVKLGEVAAHDLVTDGDLGGGVADEAFAGGEPGGLAVGHAPEF